MRRHHVAVLALAALPALATAQRPQPAAPPVPPGAVMPPGSPARIRERIVMARAPQMGRQMNRRTGGPGGGQGGAIRQPGVTRLLHLRRQLELTPRQVTQLDSIERGLFAERKAMMERIQGERRALQGQGQGRPVTPDSIRARMQRFQPQLAQWRQRDSVALASAERLLTEPQRQKLREIRAYARGRADAMRQARRPRGGPAMGPMGPMPGMRPMPGPGQRMRGGDPEVEVEIRRAGPGGEEVRVERRMPRPPV